MGYWELVNIKRHLNFQTYHDQYPEQRLFYATTKASQSYHEISFEANDSLVFGPETRGLPLEILSREPAHNIRIPMRAETRSLNLSNSVAIILYEALRQIGFPGLT